MPYRVNSYTNHIYPLKLHEYLASGCPVVGSKIRSLYQFQNVVRLAGTVDEWSAALSDALSPSARSEKEVERRRMAARNHDWNRHRAHHRAHPVHACGAGECAAPGAGLSPAIEDVARKKEYRVNETLFSAPGTK